MVGLGQDIALGTLVRPNNDRPLTNAVNRFQQLDLGKKAAEEKRRREQQELQAELGKMIYHGEGGFSPLYQDRVNKLVTDSLLKQQEYARTGNRTALAAESAMLKKQMDDKHFEDKQVQVGIDNLVKEGLLDKELQNIKYMTEKDAIKTYESVMKRNPEQARLLQHDGMGNFTTSNTRRIDFTNDLNKITAGLDKGEVEVKRIRKGDEEIITTKADPKKVREQTLFYAQDPSVVDNVILTKRIDFDKAYKDLVNNPAHRGKTEEMLQTMAAAEVLAQSIENQTVDTRVKRDRASRSSNTLNFGSGAGQLTTDLNGTPTNGSIPFKITTKEGNKVNANAPTGNSFGFGTVEILNTKGDNYINVETNELMNGKTFQIAKMGEAVPVPVAVKDFTTGAGVKYKKGQMIAQQSVKSGLENGFVEYQPMVKGVVDYKANDPSSGKQVTVQRSVLAPAKQLADQIVLKQNSADAEATKQQIQNAINEANELNSRVKRKNSDKPSQKTTSTGGIDLSKFDKTR